MLVTQVLPPTVCGSISPLTIAVTFQWLVERHQPDTYRSHSRYVSYKWSNLYTGVNNFRSSITLNITHPFTVLKFSV